MEERDVVTILKRVGALLTDDHFVLSSGRHSSAYVNKDAIYPHTEEISRVALAIAERFLKDGVEVVMGPATGGCILSNRVAEQLLFLTGRDVLGIYADKDGDSFVLKRGYEKIVRGKRTLIVEDILTTGESARKVVEVAKKMGGEIIGLGAISNRGNVTKETLRVEKLVSLVNIKLEIWDEPRCPLCKKDVPINTVYGRGLEFLNHKKTLDHYFSKT